jgi:O-antigen ligase
VALNIVFVFIVVAQSYGNEIFQYIVVQLLGKNLEFSGRIYIWAEAIKVWLKNPIVGIGVGGGGNGVYFMGHWHGAHNMYLQILVDGGILSLLFFLLPIIYCMFKVKRKDSEAIDVIIAGFFSVGLGMIFEIYSTGWSLIVLVVLYCRICEGRQLEILGSKRRKRIIRRKRKIR